MSSSDEKGTIVGETTTQLADVRPQIDAPVRVLIPFNLNAPTRVTRLVRDQYISQNAFSPQAYASMRTVLQTKLVPNLPDPPPLARTTDQVAQLQTSIQDFTVLAFSSRRAGKRDVEASAYVSIGVLLDNQETYDKAIESYKKYYEICREMHDIVGEGVASNCIGVNYMLLASPPSDAGIIAGCKEGTRSLVESAIEYHQQHLVAADNGGKFVANTNLGLCYGMIGDITSAAKKHQDALRIAIKMQTLYGQSIAVGNLGMLALVKKDFTTARTCFQQHLQLSQTLNDSEAEVNAWTLLSKLSMNEGKLSESLENLEQARRVAAREGFLSELKRVLCLIGMTRAEMGFSEKADQLVASELQHVMNGTMDKNNDMSF
eukprot:CAMPEP_0182424480 /NCGR_PEP_ID=MMETSP1167-20130531/10689_1 /TAXON_ID=2988 /ORGANISM="Mallomonas Sp, Strain CCMP3275" /LENGTH=374 /DNA_ID=CAMNT_0024604325 /DNA_START=219 /DNA_END=1346 /DNA_ORIENTATION=-